MTPGYRYALYAQSGGVVAAALITISHPVEGTVWISTDPTVRLSTEPLVYGMVSRGREYRFAPVDVVLPLDERDSSPVARLAVSNVTRELMPLVRKVEGGLTALIEIVDPLDPDEVQRAFGTLEITNISYSATEIVLTMHVDMRQNEQFPKGLITPSGFPAVF